MRMRGWAKDAWRDIGQATEALASGELWRDIGLAVWYVAPVEGALCSMAALTLFIGGGPPRVAWALLTIGFVVGVAGLFEPDKGWSPYREDEDE